MTCKPHSTHHHACDCREDYFREVEANLKRCRTQLADLLVRFTERTAMIPDLQARIKELENHVQNN